MDRIKFVPLAADMRFLVIGNSGTGLPLTSLDEIFWLPGGFDSKRGERAQDELLHQSLAGGSWIIEGVFGRLIELALPRATHLVWLDLAWDECRENLVARHAASNALPPPQLIEWAARYEDRPGSTSRSGHRGFFDAFDPSRRFRLRSRAECENLMRPSDAATANPQAVPANAPS